MEKDTNDIIHALSTGPIQRYIREHEKYDVRNLVLKHKAILGIPAAHVFEQISSRKKAKEKLPLFYDTDGIIFPPSGNFEQSSSQATASYKSEIVRKILGEKKSSVADLTGGFGVDAFFLSRVVQMLHFVEPTSFLLEIARHNHLLLGAENINYHLMTAETFLQESPGHFDLIYLDPSRRNAEKKKIHALTECQPDVIKLKAEIFDKTSALLVKASPLLDIQAGIAQLACVKHVHVVSVNNECRELLFLCEKQFSGVATINAVNLTAGMEAFQFTFGEEREQAISFSDPLTYLYEPNASILKAGGFKSVAHRFDVKKIQPNTHLYTSENLIDDFPGRKFMIEKLVRADAREMKRFFPDGKANVITRNYPLTAEQLKKKMKLKDGGEKFLIGFSGKEKKFLAVARRV